jgi:hypothetical protein
VQVLARRAARGAHGLGAGSVIAAVVVAIVVAVILLAMDI